MYSVQCKVESVQCRVYSVQCRVYSVECTVYNVVCTVYIVKCTMFSDLTVPVYSVHCPGGNTLYTAVMDWSDLEGKSGYLTTFVGYSKLNFTYMHLISYW